MQRNIVYIQLNCCITQASSQSYFFFFPLRTNLLTRMFASPFNIVFLSLCLLGWKLINLWSAEISMVSLNWPQSAPCVTTLLWTTMRSAVCLCMCAPDSHKDIWTPCPTIYDSENNVSYSTVHYEAKWTKWTIPRSEGADIYELHPLINTHSLHPLASDCHNVHLFCLYGFSPSCCHHGIKVTMLCNGVPVLYLWAVDSVVKERPRRP